jgi:hypothetical protein
MFNSSRQNRRQTTSLARAVSAYPALFESGHPAASKKTPSTGNSPADIVLRNSSSDESMPERGRILGVNIVPHPENSRR